MKLLSALDAGFLLVETTATPMHVGAVEVFSIPENEDPGFVRRLEQRLRAHPKGTGPFSLKLADAPWRRIWPAWIQVSRLDLDYHLRRWALPEPGGEIELGDLIAHLHTELLDRSHPLWQIHLIEGLADRQFAIYTKIHHAVVDGIGGTRLLHAVLGDDPERRDMPPPWAPRGRRRVTPRTPGNRLGDLGHLTRTAADYLGSLPGAYGALSGIAKATLARAPSALTGPYRDPATSFNRRVTPKRRYHVATLGLDDLAAVAGASGTTINDVFLAVCGGALRRYLEERGALPRRPLVAMLPVSLRREDHDTHGNAVSFGLATLATDEPSPLRRLAAIHRATDATKQHIHALGTTAATEYTVLLAAPFVLQLAIGFGGIGPPPFNVIVSNVPGPANTLYYNGARLEAIYPVSIVTHGLGVNITSFSYAGSMHVGLLACQDTVPDSDRLASFLPAALADLRTAAPATP